MDILLTIPILIALTGYLIQLRRDESNRKRKVEAFKVLLREEINHNSEKLRFYGGGNSLDLWVDDLKFDMYKKLIVDISFTDKDLHHDLSKLYNSLTILRERLNTNVNENFLVEYSGTRGKTELLNTTLDAYDLICNKLYS